MGHTPFGYRIENGQAVIDEVTGNQVREFFANYLSGFSLTEAAKKAGFSIFHGSAKRMLQNTHYIGDDYYPAIIDNDTYEKSNTECCNRAKKLGRIHEQNKEKVIIPPTRFSLSPAKEHFADPILQAEYLYSLIESEAN